MEPKKQKRNLDSMVETVLTEKISIFRLPENQPPKGLVFYFPWFNATFTGALLGGAAHWLWEGFDLVQFKCPENDFFQGFPQADLDRLVEELKDNEVRPRIGAGSSMGGFGAIVFSSLFDLDVVLADAPVFPGYQSSLPGLHDWEETATFGFRHANPRTKFLISFDPRLRDRLSVVRLAEVVPEQQIDLLPLRGAGHPSLNALRESGLYPDGYIGFVETRRFGTIPLRDVRAKSPSMRLALGRRIADSGRVELGLKVVRAALPANGPLTSNQVENVVAILVRIEDWKGILEVVDRTAPGAFLADKVVETTLIIARAAKKCDEMHRLSGPDSLVSKWTTSPWTFRKAAEEAQKAGELDIALALEELFISKASDVPAYALLNRCKLLAELGRHAESLDAIEEIAATDQGHTFRWPLIQAAQKVEAGANEAGDAAMVLRAIRVLCALHPEGWQFYRLAEALERNGEIAEAISIAEKAAGLLQGNEAPAHLLRRLTSQMQGAASA